ncbi:hypothetical protein ABPG75_003675 [Micractinium tetrahymenae]
MATGSGSKGPQFEVFVFGHPKEGAESHEGQLGACPFSHRVLLLLEEREVPYARTYVDASHKPDWVSKANPAGTLPILKDRASGQYIADSDTISDFLEDKYAQGGEGPADVARRRLGKVADCPQPAPQLWPKFTAFLKAKGGEEEERAKRDLVEQLKMVEEAVPNEHPFVGGQEVDAWDCALAPRLYLAREGCRLLKDWDWAEDYPNTRAYLHRMTGRASWRNTASWDDDCIVADLRRHME